MANEAQLRDRMENPLNFNCGSANSIEKGAFLGLIDGRVASGAYLAAKRNVIAGIAAREKVSGDGVTSIPVFRRGIFDVIASGAVVAGTSVMHEGNNAVSAMVGTALLSGAAMIGTALETAAHGETFQIQLQLS